MGKSLTSTATTARSGSVAGAAAVVRFPDGTVRRVAVAHVRDLLRQARTRWVKETVRADVPYRQLRGAVLAEALTVEEAFADLSVESERLAADFPGRGAALAEAVRRLRVVLDWQAGVGQVWVVYRDVLSVLAGTLRFGPADTGADGAELCRITASDETLEIRLGAGEPGAAPEQDAATLLDWVRRLTAAARRERRRPSIELAVSERFAFDALSRGHASVRHWGTSGFRDHQTYMSVTDPGEGHLDGTVRLLSNLDGVIVHVEHLERGSYQDRAYVEPYRMPDPQLVRQVRLLVGDDAPVSSYVGRPIFEGAVGPSMLKTARTVAAACSDLFAQGLAECKIAIEGMTARQAVQFMRAVRAGVSRDRFTQVLSAAFNLNTPLLDDRRGALYDARMVTDRLEIGLLGAELARAGGFDKVTWDGTENAYPSRCVLAQLTSAEALTLVHRAHERGLLTYFSAGFRLANLARAVYTGVDGVGVGGAQILRYMDADTGFHGPFLEENIPLILAERDCAESAVLGQATRALSRLDRMSFEGTITAWDDVYRQELFAALGRDDLDLRELRRLLDAVAEVSALPADTENPLLAWADRLVAGGHHTLAAARVRLRSQWQDLLDRVAEARARGDLELLDLLLATVRRFPPAEASPAGTDPAEDDMAEPLPTLPAQHPVPARALRRAGAHAEGTELTA